jgi:hypothetical protein
MSRKPFVVLAVAFGATSFVACPPSQETPPPAPSQAAPPPTVDHAVTLLTPAASASNPAAPAANAKASACLADQSWLTSSALPSEVPGKTPCDFERFMWQSLLALVQPTADHSTLQFETWMPSYGIFIKDGTPTPWGQQPPVTCTNKKNLPITTGKAPRVYSDITLQAGSNQPLMDLNHELVYYGMSVNKSAYDMLTSCELYKTTCAGPLKPGGKGVDLTKYPNLAYPDSAVELKTSWMVLNKAAVDSGLFYVVPGLVQHQGSECRSVTLGLTGMHIVSKTPGSPEMIWATFEHRNNAPDSDSPSGPAPVAGGSWSFFNPGCKDCVTNLYKANTPAQVFRMHPLGNSSVGTFPPGDDCKLDGNQLACQAKTRASLAESTDAIKAINSSAQGLIKANPTLLDKVWANYELVGNVWTSAKTGTPDLTTLQGALSAANSSMETFVQNGPAGNNNTASCFSCHNMVNDSSTTALPPVGISHLFQEVRMPGGCADKALPAACAPYEK